MDLRTKCHHKEARMCLFGNLPFSTVSPALPGCHEIFILFFHDDPARGFIYFRPRIEKENARAERREQARQREGKERETKRKRERERENRGGDEEVGRITMQLFSFQLVNGF